eukprot:6209243-Pleurochrysis_carterae.AAC.1
MWQSPLGWCCATPRSALARSGWVIGEHKRCHCSSGAALLRHPRAVARALRGGAGQCTAQPLQATPTPGLTRVYCRCSAAQHSAGEGGDAGAVAAPRAGRGRSGFACLLRLHDRARTVKLCCASTGIQYVSMHFFG